MFSRLDRTSGPAIYSYSAGHTSRQVVLRRLAISDWLTQAVPGAGRSPLAFTLDLLNVGGFHVSGFWTGGGRGEIDRSRRVGEAGAGEEVLNFFEVIIVELLKTGPGVFSLSQIALFNDDW
ncbi:hypothetical protein RRG08_054444 [Elysia crispata]|uniref:Uncharacterized protein n=1 Tax=Elysia crispata TaxID=231223 RepID=A0AAE1E601_9GAST|nr:hypothetical protein RRG08_054444 [Elysia crispata]